MRISPYICPARSAGHLTVSAVRSHSRIFTECIYTAALHLPVYFDFL